MKKYDVIIIGAGAAGMMAAYSASKIKKLDVLILEKNEKVGKKIYITGKGRCNVTNAVDSSQFLNKVTRNSKFLFSSFNNFDNYALMKFIEDNGVQLKIERGNRVFPQSDKSSDIIKALKNSIRDVDIKLNTEVIRVYKEDDTFYIVTDKGYFESKNLIISTGGLSYPATGSTGDGYKFAKEFGHRITDLRATLCPIILDEDNLKEVAGTTVKHSEINVYIDGKKKHAYFGDFLFTHSGISGPIVLTMSDYLTDIKNKNIELYCNFKPAVPPNELDDRLISDFGNNPKKEIKTLFREYFPKSLGEFLVKKLSFSEDTRLCDIDKNRRAEIFDIIRMCKLNYKSLSDVKFGVVTKGGVSTKEINPKTMESKLIKNLFFAGEIIDISGLTGGYNLQIAFSTGYTAGISVNKI